MAIIRNCKIAEACFAPFVDEILEKEDAQVLQEHLQGCPDCLVLQRYFVKGHSSA